MKQLEKKTHTRQSQQVCRPQGCPASAQLRARLLSGARGKTMQQEQRRLAAPQNHRTNSLPGEAEQITGRACTCEVQCTQGAGEHCVCVCVCVCVRACVRASFSHVGLLLTPWTVACQAPLSMDSPGQNTRVGSHPLLRRILPTQR